MKPKFGTSSPPPPICNTAPPALGYLLVAQNMKLLVTGVNFHHHPTRPTVLNTEQMWVRLNQ